MKIIFNLLNTGAGNNGGTLTLFKSANTLTDLGHDVIIVDNGKNKHTWVKLKCEFITIKNILQIPQADAIIASSFRSVDSTNKCKIDNKFHWIRGWETWKDSETTLVKILKESKTKKIVNSICLQNKLKSFNIDSTIIRPGYDFDEIYPLDIVKNNNEIIIGGLFNSGAKRATKRTEWIFEAYTRLKKIHNIKLYMFGTDGFPKTHVDFYLRNPGVKEKNKIYNLIDIWCSPSELEGLHIAPAEAMLAQCAVVGNKSELAGTQDYLQNDTGLVSNNNLKDFIKCIQKLILDQSLRLEFGKRGREKILSLGNREENMKKFIGVLSEKTHS
jgi:glycosyltransferase involved in cell wall biosynthesis